MYRNKAFSLLHYIFYFDTNTVAWQGDNTCKGTITLKVLVVTIDAQWEGMGDVGSARYEPALLPPCPTIRALNYGKTSFFVVFPTLMQKHLYVLEQREFYGIYGWGQLFHLSKLLYNIFHTSAHIHDTENWLFYSN